MVYATRYFFDTSFGLCAFLGFLNFCGLSDSQAKNKLSALHFTHLALIFQKLGCTSAMQSKKRVFCFAWHSVCTNFAHRI